MDLENKNDSEIALGPPTKAALARKKEALIFRVNIPAQENQV